MIAPSSTTTLVLIGACWSVGRWRLDSAWRRRSLDLLVDRHLLTVRFSLICGARAQHQAHVLAPTVVNGFTAPLIPGVGVLTR